MLNPENRPISVAEVSDQGSVIGKNRSAERAGLNTTQNSTVFNRPALNNFHSTRENPDLLSHQSS